MIVLPPGTVWPCPYLKTRPPRFWIFLPQNVYFLMLNNNPYSTRNPRHSKCSKTAFFKKVIKSWLSWLFFFQALFQVMKIMISWLLWLFANSIYRYQGSSLVTFYRSKPSFFFIGDIIRFNLTIATIWIERWQRDAGFKCRLRNNGRV